MNFVCIISLKDQINSEAFSITIVSILLLRTLRPKKMK